MALRYEHLTRVRKVWVWIADLPYVFISHSLSVPMKANECLVLLTETASCSPSIHRGVAAASPDLNTSKCLVNISCDLEGRWEEGKDCARSVKV